MRTNFKQGIITYDVIQGQQSFLVRDGLYVSLSASRTYLAATVTHKNKNYLLLETSNITNAWGPLVNNVDIWLYWDVNRFTAIKTFGFTLVEPIVSDQEPPSITDQHWFNTRTNTMFVFDNSQWVEVIRVFVAKVNNDVFTGLGSNIPQYPYAGSQINSNIETISGLILFDNNSYPIKQSDNTFLTSEDDVFVRGSLTTPPIPDTFTIYGIAQETVPAYRVVAYTNFNTVRLATYFDPPSSFVSIATEDLLTNQTGSMCVQGIVSNHDWSFSLLGGPLWITENGELSEIYPLDIDADKYKVHHPPVAWVLTPTSIYFDPHMSTKGGKGASQQGVAPYATTTVFGVGRLSLAAANSSDPIVVGDNDPRLNPYIHPATHPSTMITTDPYNLLTGSTLDIQLQELADRPLNSLSTVDINLPQLNQYLQWNGTSWVNANVTAVQFLDDFLDVTITTPVSTEDLVFDGVKWVNLALSRTLTSDVLGTGSHIIPSTLATVNPNVGTFGGPSAIASFTVNNKGLITSVSNIPVGGGAGVTLDVSGGTTNMTFTGGPISTGTGTFTMDGTLNIANGGTNATIANDALNNLLPSQVGHTDKFLTTDGSNTQWMLFSGAAVFPIVYGGTGASTTTGALTNLTPTHTGPDRYVLTTDGTNIYWALFSTLV